MTCNTALDLTDASEILVFMITKFTSTSHILKLCFIHNERKMKRLILPNEKWRWSAKKIIYSNNMHFKSST